MSNSRDQNWWPPPLRHATVVDRRGVVTGAAAALCFLAGTGGLARAGGRSRPIRFGLTPVFLDNDLELLDALKSYFETATGMAVRLVQRRTYQEITSLLISGQLDAAWICGYPFVANRARLSLVAVPVWRGRPLYQSYLIVAKDREGRSIEDLAGDIHAFSDPNSNSGFLVTRALLAERGLKPANFFSRTFFTYGHRNVVRAVASGLAQSGSVDGYVWEVLAKSEPDITAPTRVLRRSEWLGFPPVATSRTLAGSASVRVLRDALLNMHESKAGQRVLALLGLDGFHSEDERLFDTIAAKVELVRRLG